MWIYPICDFWNIAILSLVGWFFGGKFFLLFTIINVVFFFNFSLFWSGVWGFHFIEQTGIISMNTLHFFLVDSYYLGVARREFFWVLWNIKVMSMILDGLVINYCQLIKGLKILYFQDYWLRASYGWHFGLSYLFDFPYSWLLSSCFGVLDLHIQGFLV